MPRDERPMKKVLVRLFERDLELLRQYFPRAGYNAAVRQIVHKTVRRLEAETARALTREELASAIAEDEDEGKGRS